MEPETLSELARAVAGGARVTVLTGAGISAESGVPTFRDLGGLWQQYSFEQLATPEAFRKDPALVHAFYNERRRRLLQVQPNPAHHALVRLEEALGERYVLITQNVDDLHERAGSRRLLHMHGELRKVRCTRCAEVLAWDGDLSLADECAQCGAALRPHIVWFGEMPFHMDRDIPRALRCDLFISIGTSGVVYPAAGFVQAARAAGARTMEINLEPSANAREFDWQVIGRAGAELPRVVERILGGQS